MFFMFQPVGAQITVPFHPQNSRFILLPCAPFNPLSPKGDEHEISPCKINAYSIPKVMRIEDMVTQDEFS